MRVVFMGTSDFAVPVLRAVAGDYLELWVYTQPDRPGGRGHRLLPSPVKELATSLGLPVYQPASLRRAEAIEELARVAPGVIVVAAFGQILPPAVLRLPEFGCLNVHPSLLPRYRGASPVVSAILNGDDTTGVTVMLMDEGLDTGPILSQRTLPVSVEDTGGSLTARLAELGAGLLVDTLPLWLSRQIAPAPQQEELASCTKPVAAAEAQIDWTMPAVGLWRRVRAFDPRPGCYTLWQGKRLRIAKAVPVSGGTASEPGRVVALPPSAPAPVGVQTGAGILGLVSVQIEGKRQMSAAEFIRGRPDFPGSRLASAPEAY